MIAEYERAQILERSRRGKRHRARQGEVSVLSGAPFGYRFIRKTDHSAACFQIDEEQARVVRRVFELYSVEGLSIGAITRLLNEQAIPTCKQRGRWELGLGHAAQSGVQRASLLWQDDDCAAPAHHAADTAAWWHRPS
jgi:site-specific DNA recombinase